MVMTEEVDVRTSPRHWDHASAVEPAGEGGAQRSVRAFDTASNAVHKVHLRGGGGEPCRLGGARG
jgi:putative heme degradation protein